MIKRLPTHYGPPQKEAATLDSIYFGSKKGKAVATTPAVSSAKTDAFDKTKETPPYIVSDPEVLKALATVAKMQTQDYRETVQALMDTAKARLETFISKGGSPAKAALVWDIDETILDNTANYINRHLEGTPYKLSYFIWMQDANAPAIPETLALFKWAHQQGFNQYFVTSRKEKNLESTIKNLTRVGITPDMYKEICLKPKDFVPKDKEKASEEYKAGIRVKIEAGGEEILLVIGDMASDVAGVPTSKAIKLPNDMYEVK